MMRMRTKMGKAAHGEDGINKFMWLFIFNFIFRGGEGIGY